MIHGDHSDIIFSFHLMTETGTEDFAVSWLIFNFVSHFLSTCFLYPVLLFKHCLSDIMFSKLFPYKESCSNVHPDSPTLFNFCRILTMVCRSST